MIELLTGYSGAGKTTLVKSWLKDARHEHTEYNFPPFQKGGQRAAYSVWTLDDDPLVVIGFEPGDRLNRNGGDAFFFSKKIPFANWLCDLDDEYGNVLLDFYSVSPSMVKTIQERGNELLVMWLDTDLETCIARRKTRGIADMRWDDAEMRAQMKRARNSFDRCTAPKKVLK